MATLIKRVESSKGDGTSYALTVEGDGTVVCECKGFRYRGKCRHVASVTEAEYRAAVGEPATTSAPATEHAALDELVSFFADCSRAADPTTA